MSNGFINVLTSSEGLVSSDEEAKEILNGIRETHKKMVAWIEENFAKNSCMDEDLSDTEYRALLIQVASEVTKARITQILEQFKS